MIKKDLILEDVMIGYRNFAGVEGPYNKAGDRSFAAFLDEALAERLLNDGWNVKWPKEKDDISSEEDTRLPYLPIAIGYNNYPPKVIIIANDNKTKLGEAEIEMLDYADIINVDIVVRPYNYTVLGKTGVKAYVKSLYVTIEVDAFYDKYEI